MKKKIFAILLSFTIVAGMMPDNTLADDAASMQHDHCFCGMNEYSQGHDHDSLISWKPLSEINDAIDSGYYYLTGDIHTTSEWKINSTVALCLNGYSIICDSDTAAINIERGGQLTITDCSADETGTITHSDGKNGRGIYSMGKLDLWRGSVAGNQYYVKIDYSSPDDYYDYYDRPVDYGTGIYNGGTFNMYGGSVKDNPINPNNENTASFGGGVYNSSAFNMYGGSISGNHAQNGGGGVCNRYSGIFNFSGGEISNNRSGGSGGGVLNEESYSTFNMTGGVISGNRTERSGGGVSNDGTFNLLDGSITGNVAKDDDYETFGQGGGVSNFNGKIYMSGGTISNNECQYRGGGVWNFAEDKNTTIFEMTGGSIINNKATSTNIFSGGGGVAAYAISMYDDEEHISKVNIIMKGGTISGNKAYNGGGIWGFLVDNSKKGIKPEVNFILSNGTISNNTAKDSGGGIFSSYGTINMSGGKISENNASLGGGVYFDFNKFVMTDGIISKNQAKRGGGVANYGTFEMSGSSEISENKAIVDNKNMQESGQGGGVFNCVSDFTMSGGRILGNNAEQGGGVYSKYCTMALSGAPSITDNNDNNLYIVDRKRLSAKDLTDGAKIGVTVVSTEYPVPITDDSADVKYFMSDDPAYIISTDSDGCLTLRRDGDSYVEKPDAVFTANGPDCGKLTGVDSAMKYSIDGGTTWHDITGESVELTGLSVANGILVVRKGTDDKNVSETQNITITKAEKPSALKAEKMSSSSDHDGRIVGFEADKKYEYRKEGETSWKAVTGSSVDSLMAGNYQVRVKAEGTKMASDYTTITIDKKESSADKDHIYSDTTYTWSADNFECTAERRCTVCGKTDSETVRTKAEVTQEKTCTLPELTKYTADFRNTNGTDFKEQTKENVQTADAAGHKWDGGVQTKEPTYTDEGQMRYTCKVCGDTKTESVDKLELNEYDILEGKDGSYVINEDGSYSIRINCVVEYFVAVEVDGKTVDPKHYTVKSGSTIVTFTREFLDSLGTGKHDVKFIFTNGTAKATITAVESSSEETKGNDQTHNETENSKSENSNIQKQVTENKDPQKQVTTKQEKPKTAQKPTAKKTTKKQAVTQQKKASETGDNNAAMWVFILLMFGGTGIAAYGKKNRRIR